MPKDRITILRNKDIYTSYDVAVSALNRYVETNSLLDGEPVLGRYYDEEGVVKTLMGVCVVLEREDGCITKEILNFINGKSLIELLAKVAFTGEAADVHYDNTSSGLDSENVQEAIDELSERVGAGKLDTTSEESLQPQGSESLSGNVKLHKVSKTGSYEDLVDTPNPSITGEEGITVTSSGAGTTEPSWTVSLNMPDIANPEKKTIGGILVSASFPTIEQAEEQKYDLPAAMISTTGEIRVQRPDNITKDELSDSLITYIEGLVSEIRTTDEFEYIMDSEGKILSLRDNAVSFMRMKNPAEDPSFGKNKQYEELEIGEVS